MGTHPIFESDFDCLTEREHEMDFDWKFNIVLAFLCSITALALLFCVSRKTIESIFIDRARAKRQAEREAATVNQIYSEVPSDLYDTVIHSDTSQHRLSVAISCGQKGTSQTSLSQSEYAASIRSPSTVHDKRRMSVNPASPIKSYRMNSVPSMPRARHPSFQLSHNDLVEEESGEFDAGLELKLPSSSNVNETND